MVREYTWLMYCDRRSNAALCAALTHGKRAHRSAVEAARGNGAAEISAHTKPALHVHDAPQDAGRKAILKRNSGRIRGESPTATINERLARRWSFAIPSQCRDWMRKHGVNFQPPLSGALHVARAPMRFYGRRKAAVNAGYRSAERLGVQIAITRRFTRAWNFMTANSWQRWR